MPSSWTNSFWNYRYVFRNCRTDIHTCVTGIKNDILHFNVHLVFCWRNWCRWWTFECGRLIAIVTTFTCPPNSLVNILFLCCLQATRRSTTWTKCITCRKQHNAMECCNIWVSISFWARFLIVVDSVSGIMWFTLRWLINYQLTDNQLTEPVMDGSYWLWNAAVGNLNQLSIHLTCELLLTAHFSCTLL